MKFKEWKNPIISGATSGLVIWGLKEFKEEIMNHVISFLITFSPVFIGFLVFFIYWLIRDYRKLHQSTQELHKFKDTQLLSYHKWLESHPQAQYNEESAYFENRVCSILKWWNDTQK